MNVAVKLKAISLVAVCTLFYVHSLSAQEGANRRNAAAALLKRFPDADTDGNGELSMQEALAYAEAHPEVRQLLSQRPEKATGPRVTQAGSRSTRDVNGKELGPRVCVCAHSFMIFTGQQLPPIAESAGIAYRDAGTQMIGGSRTLQHWQVPDDKNHVKTALRSGSIDVLLLSPHLLLPDEGIDNFAKLGIEQNPELRVFIQASWPSRDGTIGTFANAMRDETSVEDLQEMRRSYEASWQQPLERQIKSLNDQLGKPVCRIVPVGQAVFALRERVANGMVPGVNKQSELFRDDLGHPQPPLATLVTYCHFAAIYDRSPVGLPVPETIKNVPECESLNTLLQEIAWQTIQSYAQSSQ